MTSTHASQEYLRTKVLAASPIEAVVLMYELAIESLNSAIAHLHSGDAMARSKAVTKAQEAVNELALAVDHSTGAAFTSKLVELYAYVGVEIVKGHTEQSETAFLNAIAILKTLLEGWSQIQSPASAGELNAESVAPKPAGFGYGQDPSAGFESRDWTC